MDKEKIKPLYKEFVGYLSYAPIPQSSHDYFLGQSLWEDYNKAVDLLIDISGEKDYGRFRIVALTDNPFVTSRRPFVYVNTYREKIAGLVSRLHGQYFADEPFPLSKGPNTLITQSQQQSQSIHLDILSKIDESFSKYPEGSPEKNFFPHYPMPKSSN
jgi:hypothetical protein